MDAFYASVEQRDHPELRGKPVIVGGNPEGRGVVSTASYEAREFGICSAMPAAHAKRLCPQAIFLSPNFEQYEKVSQKIHAILHNYTEILQPVALDEAYLDVTRNKLHIDDPSELARLIKQNIFALTQLTASGGVAPNKFLAKIASDMKKPNGLVIVYPEDVQKFLSPLPIRKIPGVGAVTEKKLHELGLQSCEDLLLKTKEELIGHFGKFGLDLYQMARGIDRSPVETEISPKQVGAEETFEKDLLDLETMEKKIRELSDSAALKLEQENLIGKTVTLKVKYSDFHQITRSRTLPRATKNSLTLAEEAIKLLQAKTEVGHRKIRLLGVSLSRLETNRPRKLEPDLFSSNDFSNASL